MIFNKDFMKFSSLYQTVERTCECNSAEDCPICEGEGKVTVLDWEGRVSVLAQDARGIGIPIRG